MHHLVPDAELHRRLRLDARPVRFIHQHREAQQLERRLVIRRRAPHQHLERSVRGFELEPRVLELLDPLEQGLLGHAQPQPQLLGAHGNVAPPGELAHDHPHLVAHERGIDVLIAPGRLRDRGDVDPALVGERAAADVWLVRIGIQVRDCGHEMRCLGETAQLLRRQEMVAQLELQVGDERHQVHVAAALAVAVDRSLHVDAPGAHRGKRVRHGESGVVVRVDPEGRGDVRAHLADPLLDDLGQFAAVGVAQHDAVGAGIGRRAHRGVGISDVEPTGVEKVLGVVDDFPPQALQVGDAVADHPQVLVPVGLEHPLHVEYGGLADQGHDRRLRLEQRPQVGVVLRASARAPGHPERGHLGPAQPCLGDAAEELGILGVRSRPAAFEIVNAQVVQAPGDLQLVLDGERKPFALGPVAERRVVQHQVHSHLKQNGLSSC